MDIKRMKDKEFIKYMDEKYGRKAIPGKREKTSVYAIFSRSLSGDGDVRWFQYGRGEMHLKEVLRRVKDPAKAIRLYKQMVNYKNSKVDYTHRLHDLANEVVLPKAKELESRLA